MRYVKSLGLLAVAAAALVAFAGTASATTLTSPEGTTYTGEIKATSTNSELHGAFVTVKCNHSELRGDVTSHGGAEVGAHIDQLTFTECNYPVTVTLNGTISINGSNVVKSIGLTIDIHTSVGTCVFTTNSTVIGSLWEGIKAFFRMLLGKLPRTGGNFLCGSSGEWTGDYDLTTPNDLWVD